jgi:hypothetical protein
MTVGQVLEKAEDELLSLRNFGRKSYDELRDRLFELGFLAPEGPKEEVAEAPSVIEEEELPAVAAVTAPAVEEVAPPEEPVVAEELAAAPAEPVAEEVVVEEIAAPAEPEAVVATPPKRERKRAKAGETPAPAEGEEEEIPDWQRKLMALKKEVGEEGEEG